MKAGLLDILLGHFGDDIPVGSVPESEHRLRSVIGNLTHLFNTRQGSVEHLPDYGLPDLGTVYRAMPDSTDELRRYVQQAVEKHEPRLGRVRVKPQASESSSMRLMLVVTAELDGQRIRLKTTFSSSDSVTVDTYGRGD
ncbi:MAG: type VI secretion system baseplate subunit TssE [Rhodothermales bacterium]|nr:type VI secretion system baseplate subunit TssE [Rhodothermales bacterium]